MLFDNSVNICQKYWSISKRRWNSETSNLLSMFNIIIYINHWLC